MLCEPITCTGCGACINRCPVKCIKMVPDREGFLLPKIDMEKCVHCLECDKACPILNPAGISRNKEPKVYACWNLDEMVRMDSSSGGMFSAFAEYILENGGVVFGAAFDGDFRLRHVSVRTKKELCETRQSKYFQSEIGAAYAEVKTVLEAGGKVFFTGTPCQVAGLYGYMGGNGYPGLFTADLICHGVPSPLAFKRYKENLEDRFGATLLRINFRNNKNSWHKPFVDAGFKNKKKFREDFFTEDTYGFAFLSNICLRRSCYGCHFKGIARYGDLTLGDFWGIGKREYFGYSIKKGISLVMINSDKGAQFFNAIQDKCFSRERAIAEAKDGNPMLYRSAIPHPGRNSFFLDLELMPFDVVVRKYFKKYPVWRKLLSKVIKVVLTKESA